MSIDMTDWKMKGTDIHDGSDRSGPYCPYCGEKLTKHKDEDNDTTTLYCSNCMRV